MKNEKIENVQFADNSFTRVRFNLVDESSGSVRQCEMKVPENHEKGKNKYWDRILENHTIDELKEERKLRMERAIKHREQQKEIQKGAAESRELSALFEMKSRYIRMPFVETDEQKRIIRKAPNAMMLDFAAKEMMTAHMKKHNLSIEELFDEVDDALYGDDDDDNDEDA